MASLGITSICLFIFILISECVIFLTYMRAEHSTKVRRFILRIVVLYIMFVLYRIDCLT